MFFKKNNLILFVIFAFFIFFGNINNVKAACTRNNPTLSWVSLSTQSGVEGDELTYTLKIDNNNNGGCTVNQNTFNVIITKPVPNANFNITSAPAPANVAEGGNQNITLKLQSDTDNGLTAGNYPFTIKIEDNDDQTTSATKNDGIYKITELYCALKDPVLALAPNPTDTGGAGASLSYSFTVKNNDRTGCAARDFSIELTGLPSCNPNPDWWHDFCGTNASAPGMCLSPTTTPSEPLYQTGNINAQATKNENFTITSCTAAALGTYNFTITVKSGASTSTDSDKYIVNALGAEICNNAGDDDGDTLVNCVDPDCLGNSACCGNGTKEGIEACDDNGDCGFLEQCVGCGSCVSTVSDGACPIDYDDCDCNSLTGADGCEANLLTNKDNCGVCGNVCPWGCENGACLEPTGGLVPCGRIADNSDTIWNEAESCNLCHVIPLANNIIDYLVGMVGLITMLFIAIGGLMSVTSLGGSSGLTTAKMAISKSVLGFVFVLVAWVMVNLFMVVFGFIDPMGDGSWRKISCNISTTPEDTSFCGDGIVQETGNGDGVVEKCEQKESKISFIARKTASHPECVNGAGGCPTGCYASIDSDCVGISQEEAWVKSVYSCNPATCEESCTGDVIAPSSADIGLGCYMDDGDPLTSDCQKGKYVCNSALDEVTCEDVFSDINYKIAGFSCQPQYDYCCQGSFAMFGSLSYDIVRGSGGFYCDDVCKKLGKICIGVGMSGLVCSYTVHNMGNVCALPGNTASATCQRTFSAGSGFCNDGADSMGWGDTKCYCK